MIPLNQAVQASPVLSGITQRIQQSQQMLATILPLLPAALRQQVWAGPLDGTSWCLFVGNPSVGTKLRQLTPALLAALRQSGMGVEQLRLKVRVRS
jgi:hypothetical protein